MNPGDDFEDVLNEWIKKKKEPKINKYVPPPKVELTSHQKKVVVGYMLSGVSKGIFEDCEDFWDGVADIDDSYLSYRKAVEEFVEEFVEELRQKILGEL